MKIIEVAAFSDGNIDGNPAGVFINDHHAALSKMQAIISSISGLLNP